MRFLLQGCRSGATAGLEMILLAPGRCWKAIAEVAGLRAAISDPPSAGLGYRVISSRSLMTLSSM
jgi:hypothetical protein